jgi:hypothetical protein
VARGATGKTQVLTQVNGGFNSAISLTASGQGSGVQVALNPATIAAPGSGHAVMQIRVSSSATTGTRTITVTATGGGITKTTTVTLTIK